MRKQAIYIVILIALAILASCSTEPLKEEDNLAKYIEGDNVVDRTGGGEGGGQVEIDSVPVPTEKPVPMGAFKYSGTVPGGSESKVPICKDAEPAYVHFDITGPEGEPIQRESPVTLENGKWISEPDSLPMGRYVVNNAVLMSVEGEPLYALPNENEPDFTDYVESTHPGSEPTMEQLERGILPVEMVISETPQTIGGIALCYIPSTLPVDGGFGPGIQTMQLQTLVAYVTGLVDGEPIYDDHEAGEPNIIGYDQVGCIDVIYVVVDNYRVIERYTYSGGYIRYPLLVPADYDTMRIYSSDDQSANSNITQSYTFTRENPYNPDVHGALLFDECDEQRQ